MEESAAELGGGEGGLELHHAVVAQVGQRFATKGEQPREVLRAHLQAGTRCNIQD